MENEFDNLLQHLKLEYKFWESYLGVLKEQTRNIVVSDIAQINSNLAKINMLVEENNTLVQKRHLIFQQLARKYQLQGEDITITNIVNRVPAKWRQQLHEQKDRLVTIIQKVAYQVETNKFLLKYALDFMHQLVKINDRGLRKDIVYSRRGRREDRADQRKILDQRV